MSQIASPDRESFHIGVARLAYIEGHLTLDEFEAGVAHVLAGGTLDQHGRFQKPPPNAWDEWMAQELGALTALRLLP